MTREEARKLLSGYATGSLTELEQQLLFDATLEDQELFDELAHEQEMKELVELPGAKRRLLFALGPKKTRAAWWPWAAGVAAVATIAVGIWVSRPREAPLQVAKVEAPVSVQPVAPPPAAVEPVVPPQVTVATAPPEKTVASADQAKPIARDEIAPAPAQLEARARPELPGVVGGQLKSPATAFAPQAFLTEPLAPAVAREDTLTYEVRNTGILRMTSSRTGVLEVTFDGRPLYPANPVSAGTTIDVSIPLEAKQLSIDFAGDANAPEAAAVSGELSGRLTLPSAPNQRVVITIPAQR